MRLRCNWPCAACVKSPPLPQFYRLSKFPLYPYPYNINDGEIAHLIEIPLIHFISDEIFEIKPYEKDGHKWQVHFYKYDNELVWGVTGFLLSNFLSIVFGLDRNISEVKPA